MEKSSKEFVLSLFIDCNELRELVQRLEGEVDIIQEISMNASIVAGQTGSQVRVFSEIARQIGSTSQKLSLNVIDLQRQINYIMNLSLKSLNHFDLLDKFQVSLPRISGIENKVHVQSVIANFEKSLMLDLREVRAHCQETKRWIQMIAQGQNKLFATLNSLKIEAGFLDRERIEGVASLAQTLEVKIDDFQHKIARIDDLTGSFLTKFSESEGQYAS